MYYKAKCLAQNYLQNFYKENIQKVQVSVKSLFYLTYF